MAGTAQRIDVHHHFGPPGYIAEVSKVVPLSQALREWAPERSLELMQNAGIRAAVFSLTIPGVGLGDDAERRRLARASNEFAAELGRAHPGTFGSFAVLPLPDIDGSLAEIAYALDVLKADGVEIFTSYGTDWLGAPVFAPVFEELDRRKAVVFVHPTTPHCRSIVPDLNDTIVEFGAETARTIANLVFSGAASKYQNVRFIFANAGGSMPYLISRFMGLAEQPQLAARMPRGLFFELQRFFYDTAQAANPGTMSALMHLVPAAQILFGTDAPGGRAKDHVDGLLACSLSAQQLRAIEYENAEALLPRMKAR